MNKVCVIAGQSGYEVVKEFQKRNISVLLICGENNEPGSDIADAFLRVDLAEADCIISIMKSYSEFVFFGTGHNLAILLAKKCKDQGFIINFNVEVACLFKNKLRTHQFIKSLGYKSPLLHVITTIEDSFLPSSYPVVLKSEADTYKTEMISDVQNFINVKKKILETGSSVIVERFIDGYEVTIPLKVSEEKIEACTNALDMKNINKKAVSILKGFDLSRESNKPELNSYIVTAEIKEKISGIVVDIVDKSKFKGYPRFDIMIDMDENVFILEVNSIMVTAVGGSHYPWEDVNMNPAADMVELFLDLVT